MANDGFSGDGDGGGSGSFNDDLGRPQFQKRIPQGPSKAGGGSFGFIGGITRGVRG